MRQISFCRDLLVLAFWPSIGPHAAEQRHLLDHAAFDHSMLHRLLERALRHQDGDKPQSPCHKHLLWVSDVSARSAPHPIGNALVLGLPKYDIALGNDAAPGPAIRRSAHVDDRGSTSGRLPRLKFRAVVRSHGGARTESCLRQGLGKPTSTASFEVRACERVNSPAIACSAREKPIRNDSGTVTAQKFASMHLGRYRFRVCLRNHRRCQSYASGNGLHEDDAIKNRRCPGL